MQPANANPRTSGALVLEHAAAMRRRLGPEAFERALARMPEAARLELDGILPMSTVSLPTVHALVTACAEEAREPPLEFLRGIVRTGTERAFNTFWRFLLRLTTDEALLKRVPSMYAQTYDGGEAVARVLAPGRAELGISGWRHFADLDGEALAVGIETVLRMASRREPKVTWARTRQGARFDIVWQP